MGKEENKFVRLLRELDNEDTEEVGGKNASLGEMIGALSQRGIQVPGGFATTAKAYRTFIEDNELEQTISGILEQVGHDGVEKVGPKIRKAIMKGKWPSEVEAAIRKAYREFSEEQGSEASVAVRSSATAEDLPEASFAGQQETYLNVSGEDDVLEACKKCYASLFTDRAISYREEKNFDHMAVALSAGVQLMVRGDIGASGVMFTLDTDSGFREVVVINGAWGLGETVVGGEVNPDEYVIFKPKLQEKGCLPIIRRSLGDKTIKAVYSKKKDRQIENKETPKKDRKRFVLSDEEAVRLAEWGKVIETHYAKPMDIEWAKDGETDELYILQARPETVESQKDRSVLTTYTLESTGEALASGIAIGHAAANGKVRKLKSPEQGKTFEDGDVLVTEMTDPDWGPIMKRAAAVVTDKGGRTAHAAIVSRELGIPAIVGTGDATEALSDGQEVTIDCTRGSKGYIYEGRLPVEKTTVKLDAMPETKTEIMMNLASPEAAFRWASLPTRGIGLARIEFIINNTIQAHPLALLEPKKVKDKEARANIRALLEGWKDGSEFFIRQLSEGIATIAASQYPKPTIVRLSDFKTNEYAELIGGSDFEGDESNPMLGFRGAARYQSEHFKEAFALECAALKRAREIIGLDNIIIMIPFCRTPEEVDGVLASMAENGLVRGEKGLQVYLMAEVPANVFQAEEFASRCDGFSIGSNDLTQLVLGISRDSEALSPFFNEMDRSVTTAIEQLIEAAHSAGIKIGICGQGPSDKPDFAEFLVAHGIDSMSLNPDSVVKTLERVAELEDRSRD